MLLVLQSQQKFSANLFHININCLLSLFYFKRGYIAINILLYFIILFVFQNLIAWLNFAIIYELLYLTFIGLN